MKNLGKKVIVRSDRAGVFFGTLAEKKGNEIKLKNARKLYYWSGANAVEELSKSGVKRPKECKFTVTVSEITLNNFIQILPCTPEAIQNINSVPEWKQ